jgi:hypothetical protein
MSDDKALTQLIEEVVDQGATTVEEIHRAIADMPLGVLEQLGMLERTASEVRRIQDVSLGAIYGLIRDVNHKVSGLAGDLLERSSSGGDVDTED